MTFFLQSSPKVQEILLRTKNYPQRRMDHIYDLCKTKKVCEGGDEIQPSGEGEGKVRK